MRLIRGLLNLTVQNTSCVATIGKFDGIHTGHRQILDAVKKKSQALGVESVVIVFEPDPQEYFAGEKAPARLTRFREKWERLHQLGIDKVVCLNFNEKLASMTAETFIDSVLIERLKVCHLIVGDDFRFGAKRLGDYRLLEERGQNCFTVQTTLSVKHGTERISSTLVREHLKAGRLNEAKKLLGQDFKISGRVSHGDKIGRTLGFPTLNIPLSRNVSPIHGVFFVKVESAKDNGAFQTFKYGVANVGFRPTLNKHQMRLEVFVFDFDGNCYGEYVHISFIEKLRDEKKFNSLEDLKTQINLDIENARKLLKKNEINNC